MKPYSFKTVPPEWLDCETWPTVSVDHLDSDQRARFERLELAIRTYLRAGALGDAAAAGQCSKQSVLDKLNRCLTIDDEGRIAGWRGLLLNARLGEIVYTRTALPSGARAAERGAAGAFEAFLNAHESVRRQLHQAIRNGGSTGPQKRSRHPTLRSVFASFLDACKAEGLTAADYPLNSRSKGRRSVERYVAAWIPTNPTAVETWFGTDARDQMKFGTGKRRFPLATTALDLCGADAHKIHCYGVVIVNGPAGPQPIPIERIWLFPILDLGYRCILGYAVSIQAEISAATIEEALAACAAPWSPRKLIVRGHTYKPGAGLPVGSIEGLTSCRPCALQIDNAAQHYSNRLIQTARRALGCAVTFGPVGAWWRNAVTERLFRSLEMYGFQCEPSSTGSSPTDVHKGDSIKNAMRDSITWEELLDLIDVEMANYNATGHSALGGQTPLDAMRRGIDPNSPAYLPRDPVPATAFTPAFGVTVERRPIRGGMKPGSARVPSVMVDELRYSNDELSSRYDLIGQELLVHIREIDMSISAFLADGRALGALRCVDADWGNRRHPRAMRKVINALIRYGRIAGKNPLIEYLEYLTKQTLEEVKAAPGKVSPAATQLAEASRVTGLEVPSNSSASREAEPPLIRTVLPHIKRPTWRSS